MCQPVLHTMYCYQWTIFWCFHTYECWLYHIEDFSRGTLRVLKRFIKIVNFNFVDFLDLRRVAETLLVDMHCIIKYLIWIYSGTQIRIWKEKWIHVKGSYILYQIASASWGQKCQCWHFWIEEEWFHSHPIILDFS